MKHTTYRGCYIGFPNFCKTENCPYWSHYANCCTYSERTHVDRAVRRSEVRQLQVALLPQGAISSPS